MAKKNYTPKAKRQKHNSTPPKRGITNEQIEQSVNNYLFENPSYVFSYKQICSLFGSISMSQKRQVVSVLEAMTSLGILEEVEFGRYKASAIKRQDRKVQEGVITFVGGRAFFRADGSEEDISIAEQATSVALSGDRVCVAQVNKRGRHRDFDLEVVKILERSNRTYVGNIVIARGRAFFESSHRELRKDVFIPDSQLRGAKRGDKVVVRVEGWSPRDKNPFGSVIDVLGVHGDNNTEMHAILAEYGLPYDYPQNIASLADTLSGKISAEELSKREDFRGVPTFTIDPRDAKDFDDALSLRKTAEGYWEVGVHIADVSHFVKPNDPIDQEAYARATSIYLVDRTIPMLPERLSNDLCSLRPNEERYAYSCIFEFDDQAHIVTSRIVRTVIQSNRRFTYEEAQGIIESKDGEYSDAILTLNRLAQKLRDSRFAQGSIAFERPEVRFEIDKDGTPLSVYIKESLEAHQLIEEFMLLANKTVAERIGLKRGNSKERAFVYRIHDTPDTAKLEQLSQFATRLGYVLKVGKTPQSLSQGLNKFLRTIKGIAEENLFSTLAVRSMAKACYSTDNIGHYGLAFKYYSHFTSPIRRYPDLIVHRLLSHYLDKKNPSVDKDELERNCEHCSSREVLASQAERASIRYKQVEYMMKYLGEEFEGVVSGISEWGIYVEIIETKCEGMISTRELVDDYYEYHEQEYALVGRRSGKRYTIGDPIRIQVAQANLERRYLDFRFADDKQMNKYIKQHKSKNYKRR